MHHNTILSGNTVIVITTGNICQCLTPSAMEQLVHSLVATRLDSCNSLSFGIVTSFGLEHGCSPIVIRLRKSELITPVLMALHRLLVH